MFDLAKSLVVVVVIIIAVSGGAAAVAADWPQFRGAEQNGISAETGLLHEWPDGGPARLWTAKLGNGYSGITVVDKRIYTMFGRGGKTWVGCFDADSGDEIWTVPAGSEWKDRQGDGPRSTPTVEGDVVYALTANGKLYALKTADGEVRWERDLVKDYEAEIPKWGMSGSPVIVGNLLLLEVGGPEVLMAAFDKNSGEEVWRSRTGKAGYSTPYLITTDGVRQAVFFTAEKLYSVAPDTGKVYWQKPWKTSWDVNAAMPIFIEPNRLFVSSGYDTGAALLKIAGDARSMSVEEVWVNREMKNQFSSSIYHEGHIYGFDNKNLKCIDAETGEMKWRQRDLGHGSLMLADGHLIVLGDKGQLVLVEATPAAYREKGRVQLFSGKTWTVPTLSNGILFARDESEMIALKVAE
jgi:outer membrane protein assembly factor BamB